MHVQIHGESEGRREVIPENWFNLNICIQHEVVFYLFLPGILFVCFFLCSSLLLPFSVTKLLSPGKRSFILSRLYIIACILVLCCSVNCHFWAPSIGILRLFQFSLKIIESCLSSKGRNVGKSRVDFLPGFLKKPAHSGFFGQNG